MASALGDITEQIKGKAEAKSEMLMVEKARFDKGERINLERARQRKKFDDTLSKGSVSLSADGKKAVSAIEDLVDDIDDKTTNVQKRARAESLQDVKKLLESSSMEDKEKKVITGYIDAVNKSLLAERNIIMQATDKIGEHFKNNVSLTGIATVLSKGNPVTMALAEGIQKSASFLWEANKKRRAEKAEEAKKASEKAAKFAKSFGKPDEIATDEDGNPVKKDAKAKKGKAAGKGGGKRGSRETTITKELQKLNEKVATVESILNKSAKESKKRHLELKQRERFSRADARFDKPAIAGALTGPMVGKKDKKKKGFLSELFSKLGPGGIMGALGLLSGGGGLVAGLLGGLGKAIIGAPMLLLGLGKTLLTGLGKAMLKLAPMLMSIGKSLIGAIGKGIAGGIKGLGAVFSKMFGFLKGIMTFLKPIIAGAAKLAGPALAIAGAAAAGAAVGTGIKNVMDATGATGAVLDGATAVFDPERAKRERESTAAVGFASFDAETQERINKARAARGAPMLNPDGSAMSPDQQAAAMEAKPVTPTTPDTQGKPAPPTPIEFPYDKLVAAFREALVTSGIGGGGQGKMPAAPVMVPKVRDDEPTALRTQAEMATYSGV